MPVIEGRKLAAVDIGAGLGERIVVAGVRELGVLLPLALGIFSIEAGVAQQSVGRPSSESGS